MMKPYISSFLSLALLIPGVTWAQLNSFSPGDSIKSSEMNENFEYLQQRIEELESQIDGSGSGGGDLTSCSRSDLVGSWIAVTADTNIGYRAFSYSVSSSGSISGQVVSSDGNFSLSGSINIRSDCTLSSLSVSAGGISVRGVGYGALAKTGATMVSTVEDSYGYSWAFTAVKLP